MSALDYADVHESGQLRLSVAGDQRPLLPLPDAEIPQISAATDEARSAHDRDGGSEASSARCESGVGGERSRPEAVEAARAEWWDWRDRLWQGMCERYGYPGLAFLEQLMKRSAKEKRCSECGAAGTVRHDRPRIVKSVDLYWFCGDCEHHFLVNVAGEQLVVGLA